jgi:transposase
MLAPIVLRLPTDKERETLEKLARSQTAPVRQVERAKTVLLAQTGMRPVDIAEKLDRTPATIYRRLRLFNETGLESMDDQPRAG